MQQQQAAPAQQAAAGRGDQGPDLESERGRLRLCECALLVPGMREQFKQAWDHEERRPAAGAHQRPVAIYAAIQRAANVASLRCAARRAMRTRQRGRGRRAMPAARPGSSKRTPTSRDAGQGCCAQGDPRARNRRPGAHPRATRTQIASTAKPTAPAKAGVDATPPCPDQVKAAALKNKDTQSQIDDRANRFALDKDKFRSETGLKVLELQDKLGDAARVRRQGRDQRRPPTRSRRRSRPPR
jgi:hypothetical protein